MIGEKKKKREKKRNRKRIYFAFVAAKFETISNFSRKMDPRITVLIIDYYSIREFFNEMEAKRTSSYVKLRIEQFNDAWTSEARALRVGWVNGAKTTLQSARCRALR